MVPLAAAAISCGRTRLGAVPPELVGTWVSEGRYDRRYLEIESDSFSLGAGGLDLGVYRIKGVDARSVRDNETIYRLHHRADEGYDDELVLTYQSDPTPTLRVGASPEPWTRTFSLP